MAFDLSTAKPITTQTNTTGFDLSTAKRFDLSTAKPIEGSVTKEQKPVGQLEDIARGAMSGLSYFGRGGANLVNEYVRPALGKAKLSQDELNKRLSIIGAQEYNPETFLGKTAKFAGEVAPTLAVKSVTVPAQTLLGATLGATEAANRGDNVVGGALMGGGIGLLGALGLKGAGKLFEVSQPYVAKVLAGISPESSRLALNSIKSGKSIFNRTNKVNEEDVINKINNAYNEVYKPDEYFINRQNLVKKAYDKTMQGLKNNSGKEITTEGTNLQSQLDALKNYSKVLESSINKQNNDFAKKISASIDSAKLKYNEGIAAEKQSLFNDNPVSVSDVFKIMDDAIKNGSLSETYTTDAQKFISKIFNDKKQRIIQTSLIESGIPKEEATKIAQEYISTGGLRMVETEADRIYKSFLSSGTTDNEAKKELLKLGYKPSEITGNVNLSLDELKISRPVLHDLKIELQEGVPYNTEGYKSKNGIMKEAAGKIRNILSENSSYNDINSKKHELLSFLDDNENSWLKNTNTIASKLSNAQNKSGELTDVVGKIKQLEALLPEGSQLGSDLEKMLQSQTMKREQVIAKELNLKLGSQTNIEKIKNDTQFKINAKKDQKQRLLDKVKQKQGLQKEETKFLPESIRNQPGLLTDKKNILIRNAFESLDKNASVANRFIQDLKTMQAQKEFNSVLKQNPWMFARLLAPIVGAFHNPAYLGAELLAFPQVQKQILQGYGAGIKISPYYTRLLQQAGNFVTRPQQENK